MKRMWPIKVLLFVVIVGGALAIRYGASVVPYWQCSEVYKRYHKVEGVRASYIKNFPLNDTLTIGVTLLEATTDSGWAMLQRDFSITPIPPEVINLIDSNSVDLWLASKRDYSRHKDSILSNNYLIAASRFKHKIAIFDIWSEEQLDAIYYYHFNKIQNSN